MRFAKFCELEDFEDPELLAAARDLLPERDPLAHVERKVWEMAMLVLFLRDAGRLGGDAEILSVGAGIERVLYWLTNHAARVVATDVYGEGPFAGGEAVHGMLEDPGRYAPAYPIRLDRLDARWMDARRLDFPDQSFDVVYSLSSIEHFGGPADVAAAAREIGRVLRPGGHAAIATDAFIRHHPLDSAPVDALLRAATLGRRFRRATPRRRARLGEVFTVRELDRLILGPSGLRPVAPLDASVSAATVAAAAPADSLEYPLVALRAHRSVFGSVFLGLVKERGGPTRSAGSKRRYGDAPASARNSARVRSSSRT